jgi:biotin transport system substrate-specific component
MAASAARRVTTAALLAALLAVSAVVAVPIGAVPLTLQVFVVVLIALLVPPSWAALAVGAYLLVGALGLPVFAGARGGLGVLVGPTGGYLVGFFIGAVVGAALGRLAGRRLRPRWLGDALVGIVVIVIVYACGWAQLAAVAHLGASAAFLAGVAPFIVPDAMKAAVAVGLAPVVRRAALAQTPVSRAGREGGR